MAESHIVNFHDRLLSLIQSPKNEEAKLLLNKNLVKVKTNYGSLLHYASKFGNDYVARHLIEIGCDVDSLGRGNQTPLMIAVLHKNIKCVKFLLEANANIDIANDEGKTALHLLFNGGYSVIQNIFRLFLDKLKTEITSIENLAIKLMDAGCTLRHVAHLHDYNLMTCMIKCGAQVNSKSFVNKTALHAAIKLKNLRWVKWLLNNGTNVNVLDESEKNALLLLACRKADKVVLKMLLEQGVNPNAPTSDYSTRWMKGRPLCELMGQMNSDKSMVTACLELMLQYGAIPKNSPVYTVFDFAFMSHGSVWAKYLIAQLAMLEKMGISIDKSAVMHCYNQLYRPMLVLLDGYYEKCENILKVIVFRKLSLFDLLTDRESNIRSYARNEKFISEVEKVCFQHELGSLYRYYYNTLMKRINKAIGVIKLENVAIPTTCALLGAKENEYYLAARQVVSYLDEHELEQLV